MSGGQASGSIASAFIVLALALAGCVESSNDDDAAGGDVVISHVHGLAYEPGADAVYVATHHGLAKGQRGDAGWSWAYVGHDRHDYMGFTQDKEDAGVFYSSGHPADAKQFGGPHLGLRRSTDGGETWEQRSLKGQVDFHALTSLPGAEGRLAGHWQGQIKVSTDAGATWSDRPAPQAQVLALAATGDRLLAATANGLYAADGLEAWDQWIRMDTSGIPPVVLTLAAAPDGARLFASGATGSTVSTHRSLDGGASWTQIAHDVIPTAGAPVLFALDPSDPTHVLASTAQAFVLESHDGGATWTTIRAG